MSQSSIRNLVISLAVFVLVVGLAVFTFVNLLKNSQTLEKQIAVVAAQNQQEEAMIRLQKLVQSSESKRAELATHFLFRPNNHLPSSSPKPNTRRRRLRHNRYFFMPSGRGT